MFLLNLEVELSSSSFTRLGWNVHTETDSQLGMCKIPNPEVTSGCYSVLDKQVTEVTGFYGDKLPGSSHGAKYP